VSVYGARRVDADLRPAYSIRRSRSASSSRAHGATPTALVLADLAVISLAAF